MTSSPAHAAEPRRIAGTLTLMAIFAVAGCTTGSSSPSSTGSSAPSATTTPAPSISPPGSGSAVPSGAASATPNEEPTESLRPFACAPSVVIPATTARAQISDVRVGTHDGYDRIVFEFTGGIPETVIDAVLPPFYQDPSGLPLTVNGTAFLRVTMHGGTKVSLELDITYSGPTEFEPGFPQLAHLIEGGDFEAVSTWYLGLHPGGCLRVFTLEGPSRLVIDIEH